MVGAVFVFYSSRWVWPFLEKCFVFYYYYCVLKNVVFGQRWDFIERQLETETGKQGERGADKQEIAWAEN